MASKEAKMNQAKKQTNRTRKVQVKKIGQCTVTPTHQPPNLDEKPQVTFYKIPESLDTLSSNGRNFAPAVKLSSSKPKQLCKKCGSELQGRICLNCKPKITMAPKRSYTSSDGLPNNKKVLIMGPPPLPTSSNNLSIIKKSSDSNEEEERRNKLNIQYTKSPSPVNFLPKRQLLQNHSEMLKDLNISINNNISIKSANSSINNSMSWSGSDEDDSNDNLETAEPRLSNEELMNDSNYNSEEFDEDLDYDHEIDKIYELETNPEIFLCRSVRIGSYILIASIPLLFNEAGINLYLPPHEEDQTLLVTIKKSDITSLYIHNSADMSVVYLTTNSHNVSYIRNQLQLTNKEGPYYDPSHQDEHHKRIVLFPLKMTTDSKKFFNDTFAKLIQDLDWVTSNIFLNPSTNSKNWGIRNFRFESLKEVITQLILIKKTSEEVVKKNRPPVVKLLTYPPAPHKGGIEITSEDIECLHQGEFLNDVIIDFYLNYLFIEKISLNHQSKFHRFSTFFYTRLTKETTWPDHFDRQLIQENKHKLVKKWTKHVDIFDKDFIIIPVNLAAHWFVLIICFPGLVSDALPKETSENSHIEANTSEKAEEESHSENGKTISLGKANSPSQSFESDTKSIKKPCILIMDSMALQSRERVAENIRDYLAEEWLAKKNSVKIFNSETLPSFQPQVTQQNNSYDCGVFVLQFVESFLEDHTKNYSDPNLNLENWFLKEKVDKKRVFLKELITQLKSPTSSNSAKMEEQR